MDGSICCMEPCSICYETKTRRHRLCKQCNIWYHPECWWKWFDTWITQQTRLQLFVCPVCKSDQHLDVRAILPSGRILRSHQLDYNQLGRLLGIYNFVHDPVKKSSNVMILIDVFRIIAHHWKEIRCSSTFRDVVFEKLDFFCSHPDLPTPVREEVCRLQRVLRMP